MSTHPEKMDLRSMDISAENRAKIKQLFPSVFTETRNEKGEMVESLDFEKLKAELGNFTDVFESRRERYGMDWPGKKDCIKIIQQPSIATLKPCRTESVNFDTTENLFIEGDNLEVLKLLQKSYYGKVKMIYIDPPYNTGKEFIYPDNYTESLDTYLAYAGLVDDEGRRFSTNTPNEGRFHTKWLNMMYPRLYLARNLLREDGVIFISIDDNEVSNLRALMDNVFGEENFLACITWKRRQVSDNRNVNGISTDHEYVLVYGKGEWTQLAGKPKDLSKYANPDNDPRGPWMSDNMTGLATKAQRPNLHYNILNPQTGDVYPPHPGRGWIYEKKHMDELIAENRILWPNKLTGRPRLKRFLADIKDKKTGFSTVQNPGFTTDGTREVMSLFGFKAFDFPKPVALIKMLVEQAIDSTDNAIILDFFAGSCTTAHAVFNQKKENANNSKFIMVQLPEPCEEDSEAYKAGFKTIADIGKERIRRVIKKVNDEQAAKAKEAEGSLFGPAEGALPNLDLGFKVFKLDRSTFKVWDSPDPDAPAEKITQQLAAHIDHIDPAASQEDILHEILLKAGFTLTEKVEKLELAGKTVFAVSDGALLICLEDEITRELIDAVVAAKPHRFICLDRGFHGNDQLKANAVQTFAAINQGQVEEAEQIVFRTV